MTITKQHMLDLEDIAALLSEVDSELDSSQDTCSSCGRESWPDLREGRLGSEVSHMLRKAHKCIGVIKDALRQMEVEREVVGGQAIDGLPAESNGQ